MTAQSRRCEIAPVEVAVTALTMAELAAGPHVATTPRKVIGIDGADFVGSPTRWTFPDDRIEREDKEM